MSDLDNLSLPPRRPLPRDVRDRLRASVLRRPPARPVSNRMALVVAAGVAVLAMGATVLTQAVTGSHDTTAAKQPAAADGTPPPLDAAAANDNLNRCWLALANTPAASDVPARANWQPVFGVSRDGVTVTAVRALGQPLFCETTRTTVTVSNPKAKPVYAAGSRTAALLTSAAGVVAGVMDPNWQQMTFVSTGRGSVAGQSQGYHEGWMFVELTDIAGPGARYTVQQTVPGSPQQNHPVLDLPSAPAALVAMVDRPDPPADRTSPAGKALGNCIAHTDFAVPDPDSWQPLVMTTAGNTPVVLASSGSSTAACSAQDQQLFENEPIIYEFEPTGVPPAKPLLSVYDTIVPTGLSSPAEAWVALGVVRPDVAHIAIYTPTGQSVPVSITKNMFTAQWTQAGVPLYWKQVTVALWDVNGNEIYRGPVKVGD